MARKPNPRKLFDSPRQVSEPTQERPGEIEIALQRDEWAEGDALKSRAKAERRKRVFQYIQSHPGCTRIEVQCAVGTTAGLDEWLRDEVVTRERGCLYIA